MPGIIRRRRKRMRAKQHASCYSGGSGSNPSLARHYWRINLESEIDMRTSTRTRVFVFCATVIGLSGVNTVRGESNWPRWRGPTADGHSCEQGLPHQWSSDSVLWRTPLKGRGHSSPTIWGTRIFLTSALEQGKQRMVTCVDRTNGKVLWERIAWTGEPERSHGMNGWASATCATDGERVYAFFGRGGGSYCYRVDGELLWSRDLGRFESPWGTAASPLLVGDVVIQNCDSDQDAYIIALNKKTGSEVWKTKRPDHRGWSSPILIRAGERDEIVVNGHTGMTAYAPDSGKELWNCRCEAGRGSPTVTPADGLLYAVNGLSGGGAYCVRPGGSGDVTESRRLWIARRGGRDLPSPIVVGDTMLVAGLRGGILTAYDKSDGSEIWVKRLDGQVSASPVSYDGLAFFITESGDTVVIDPKSEEKIIGRNPVGGTEGELFRASITPLDGQLFLRSDQYLYCVE